MRNFNRAGIFEFQRRHKPMTFITTALGLFYIAAASLVFQRAYAETRGAGNLNTARERLRTLLIILSASLYGTAGLTLLLKSGLAVWFFAAGLGLRRSPMHCCSVRSRRQTERPVNRTRLGPPAC
jgi:hypothetical protein